MDVQQLRAFRSVVATGSVRAAAGVLGYSPSAISQQVTVLQRAAGVPLLSRIGRGVEPTRAGYALADRVDGLLGELGDLDQFVRGLREGRESAVVVGYFPSLGTTWLPHMVRALAVEYPELRVDLYATDDFDPARRPRPEVQFVVVPPGFAVPTGYRLRPVAEDPYVVVVPSDHPLAGRGSVPLSELAAESWVDNDVANAWCRRVVVDACAAAGFQPRYRIEAHDYPTAIAFVGAGLGVSVMPSLAAHSLPEGVVSAPVTRPTPVRTIEALVLAEAEDVPAVRRALELARDAGR